MKARFTFYFAAVVALVLFLVCVQSHATERRDPLIIQDTPQTQAARSSSLVHATATAIGQDSKPARKAKPAKNGHDSVKPQTEAKDKSGAKKNSTSQNLSSEPSSSGGSN
jgi:hypothetical protein